VATPNKPIAVRVLEQRKVPHELFAFDDSIRSAEEVARVTGMPPAQVYKTLVIEPDPPRGKPWLFMVPSDSEVDLRALAQAVGAKKLRMASHAGAERYTGLKVGGISALALLGQGFPVLIDARSQALDTILVSAGQRGLDLKLAVSDLVALTAARPVEGASRLQA
jgi:Cys-tRNA(Pro)/Cys-tRNA(Cys) deacylase